MTARLLDAELRRFFARRAVRWLVGAAVLIALVVNVVQLARSSVTRQVLRPAFVVGGAGVPGECRRGEHHGKPVADFRCVVERGAAGGGIGSFGPPRTDGTRNLTAFYALEGPRDRRVRIGRTFGETIGGMGVALVLLAVVLAATFLAAEFSGNGLSTELIYEPRRWRVFLAKAGAVALGCALVAAGITLWTGFGQYVASASRGSLAGVDGGWWRDRTGDLLRVMVAAALAAVISLGVTAVARRTAVAVAVFFGQMIALGFLADTSWGKGVARVIPINALWATAIADLGNGSGFAGLHTRAGAVLLASVWTGAAIVLSGAWFASREIR